MSALVSNWPTTNVGSLCDQIRGVSYSKGDAHDEPADGLVPILRANNILDDGVLSFDGLVYVPTAVVAETQFIKKHDIVLAASSGSLSVVGKAAQSTTDWRGGFGAFCKVLRSKRNVEPRYLAYFFRTAHYRHRISQLAAGANINNLRNEHIDDLEIPLPPEPEQKRIADILDKADAIRRKRQEAISLEKQLVHSAFLDMFGDPVTNPKHWEVRRMKDMSTRIMGGTTPKGGKKVYVDDGITFFRSQNVWRNRIALDDIAYIDRETHQKMARSSLKKKDILITKTGRFNTENSSLGRAALFMGQDDSANINGHVYLVRLEDGAIHEFVLFVLTMDEYREYIRRVCVGGIDKRQINKEHLEEFPIISPPRELQLRFAAIIESNKRQLDRMNAHLTEAHNLFNSLVQRAFKGEL